MVVYQILAKHLDNLPGGFPPSDTGVELRLLERLFTSEEAELAVLLTLDREEAVAIADRAGFALDEAQRVLREMALKGLIFSIEPQDSPALYQAAPWVVGIYEFQINTLDKAFVEDLAEYRSRMRPDSRSQPFPQMRTIPVGQSIEPNLEVLPYERAEELVKAHDTFGVAPCICRRRAELMDGGCDAPEESCLMFGEWADYYARNGQGRYVDRDTVLDILDQADKANLVLQPSNSREIAFLCTCCGCCCGVLSRLKQHPKPSELVATPFIATAEPDTCNGCEVCLDRCQMDALTIEDDRVVLNSDRCIGCGLCASTCPTGSLMLVRKPENKQIQIPVNMDTTWKEIGRARTEEA
jgi:ferredoxin